MMSTVRTCGVSRVAGAAVNSNAACHRELHPFHLILRKLHAFDDKAFHTIRQHYVSTFKEVLTSSAIPLY